MSTGRVMFACLSAVGLLVCAFATCLVADSAYAARKAFVVGINDYPNLPKLKDPVYDAQNISEQLKAFGYDTTIITDSQATRTQLLVSWQHLLNTLDEGDDVVVFYSGHGVEVQGANYLVPYDTPDGNSLGGEESLRQVLISFPALLDDFNKKPLNGIVWIIDACRDNPFSVGTKSLGAASGLAHMEGPAGTFFLYSAGFGQTALDRLPNDPASEKNSVYTRTLLKLLPIHAHDPITTLATTIRPMVKALAAPHDQRPAYYDGMDGPWCFEGCRPLVSQTTFQTVANKIENPTDFDVSASVKSTINVVRTFVPAPDNVQPNAVFLGKKSVAETCNDNKPSVNYPFGCDFLRRLVQDSSEIADARRRELIGKSLSPQVPVNVRLRAPTVDERNRGHYACVVETLTPNSAVTLSGILDIAYVGDTFFWGTISGDVLGCK